MKMDEGELATMQRIESHVYRTIIQGPKFTTTEGLGVEVRVSPCRDTDIKNKLTYTKHASSNDNTFGETKNICFL